MELLDYLDEIKELYSELKSLLDRAEEMNEGHGPNQILAWTRHLINEVNHAQVKLAEIDQATVNYREVVFGVTIVEPIKE